MNRIAYLGRRLVFTAITLVGLSVLLFAIMRMLPGGPAQAMLGILATPEQIAALDARYGRDQPIASQYLLYVQGLLGGDLGQSLIYQRPVRDVILSALPVTLKLAVYVVVLSTVTTVALAWLAATHRDSPIDHVVRAIPLIGIGMPAFWVGAMLLFVFALVLGILPAGGYRAGFPGELVSLFLPALTLTIATSAILVRSLRLSLIEVLDSDHVLTARAKGLRGWRLMLRHVLPNASIPTITLMNLVFISLLGGALVVEPVFGLPGIGSLIVAGFNRQDLALVMGIALLAATLILLANLVTDVVYSLIDPRVALR